MANGFLVFLFISLSMVSTQYLHRRFRLRKRSRQNGCRPPPRLPQSDSIFGIDTLVENYRHMKANTYLRLQQLRFAAHGNTYRFKFLGVTMINTIDPENVQAMLAKQFNDFVLGPSRETTFDPLIGHGIFTADGPAWQEARRLVRPSFNRKGTYDVSMFEVHVDHFLLQVPKDGTPFDLQDLFMRFTIDIATGFLFGQSSMALGRRESLPGKISGSEFSYAFDRAQRTVASCFGLGPLAFLVPKTQFRKDQKIVHRFIDQYIQDALLSRNGQEDSTKGLSCADYQFLNEFAKRGHNHEALRGALLHLLLAGRDSTASLLGNLWFMLGRQPQVWRKLQEDVATLRGAKPTYEILKQLKYLRHCINESLRLHPVVPINYRTALRDTILPTGGGPKGKCPILVPAGTKIGYYCSAMHRRTDIYGEDANEFKPERWDTIRPGWAYLPFNGGPRICLGQQFAINEASYLTVRLCQEFEGLEGLGEEEWMEDLTLTCASKNGTWVSLRPRQGTRVGARDDGDAAQFQAL